MNLGIDSSKRLGVHDAEAAVAELERIRSAAGRLHARAVWIHSTSPDNYFHGEFTWDNDEAANKCRDMEAAHLIRSVVILGTPDVPQHRYYHHVVIEDRNAYVPLPEVLRDSALRAQVMIEIRRALSQAMSKLATFEHYTEQAQKIGAVLTSLNEQAATQ